MNSQLINFKFFVESDSSPFIVFDNNSKIEYLNGAAEVLMGYVAKRELYDLTLAYAPKDFGYKTTRLELQYDLFSFYALTVAYENEEFISLRLYHKPRLKSNINQELEKFPLTDINILLEANITLFKLKNNNTLNLLVDQDLPECRIDQNRFSKLLRKVLNAFRSSDHIDISLKLLIGEYVIIKDQKEQLIQLRIRANGRYADEDSEVNSLAQQINISSIMKEYSILLQIPFIKQ